MPPVTLGAIPPFPTSLKKMSASRVRFAVVHCNHTFTASTSSLGGTAKAGGGARPDAATPHRSWVIATVTNVAVYIFASGPHGVRVRGELGGFVAASREEREL